MVCAIFFSVNEFKNHLLIKILYEGVCFSKKHVPLQHEILNFTTMKKVALSLLLSVFSVTAFSQSIQLFYNNEEVTDTLNISVNRLNDENTIWLSVKNNTAQDSLYITVHKEVISELSGSYNTFCLGNCFDPSITTSPTTLDLAAGESSTNEQFHLVYFPAGQEGITTVKYTFYDQRINEPGREVVVNFITGGVGIDDQSITAKVFNAYPNPATSNVVIQYDLAGRSADARIVITSLVGNKVYTQSLNSNSGKANIDISNLVAGIYFYSIEANGQVISTKKLIVK